MFFRTIKTDSELNIYIDAKLVNVNKAIINFILFYILICLFWVLKSFLHYYQVIIWQTSQKKKERKKKEEKRERERKKKQTNKEKKEDRSCGFLGESTPLEVAFACLKIPTVCSCSLCFVLVLEIWDLRFLLLPPCLLSALCCLLTITDLLDPKLQ